MSYTVYKHTTPNNKIYIGITKLNVKRRWLSGYGYQNNKYFFDDIVKYGWKNINHEILFENLTKKEAEEKEIQLIAMYKSNDNSYGYNISSGGHSTQGVKCTNERKRKIMVSQPARKKVMCMETGTIYESIKEASRKNKIDKKCIIFCCKKIKSYKTAGGYHWQYVN